VRRVSLVTGAAGFIGSHLVDSLLQKNHIVVGIDNLSVGQAKNLEHISDKNFTFVKADVLDLKAEMMPFQPDKFDYIFHLAALADIVPSIVNPGLYTKVNVLGTLNVLEFARQCNLEKFIYAASSSCYGIPNHYPTLESAEIKPEYPYALSKYLGEHLVLHWVKIYNLPALSLRFFNVYGPRARTSGTYGAVFGVFLAQKMAGQPLTIVGDGNQTRDFTFVSDVVDAVTEAAFSDIQGEIFNVGSGGTYSVNLLASLIGGDTINIPKRPGEPDCTFADISKIRSALNWHPKVSFEAGVKLTLEQKELWKDAPVWTPKQIESATREWFQLLGNKNLGR